MRKLGATATADGKPATEILDGDPNTYWSSADARGNGPKPPHEIIVRFKAPTAMNGLVLMRARITASIRATSRLHAGQQR